MPGHNFHAMHTPGVNTVGCNTDFVSSLGVARPFIIICANLIYMKVQVQHLITLSPLISFAQVKGETSSFNLQVGRRRPKELSNKTGNSFQVHNKYCKKSSRPVTAGNHAQQVERRTALTKQFLLTQVQEVQTF
jgi:hypothetical protein